VCVFFLITHTHTHVALHVMHASSLHQSNDVLKQRFGSGSGGYSRMQPHAQSSSHTHQHHQHMSFYQQGIHHHQHQNHHKHGGGQYGGGQHQHPQHQHPSHRSSVSRSHNTHVASSSHAYEYPYLGTMGAPYNSSIMSQFAHGGHNKNVHHGGQQQQQFHQGKHHHTAKVGSASKQAYQGKNNNTQTSQQHSFHQQQQQQQQQRSASGTAAFLDFPHDQHRGNGNPDNAAPLQQVSTNTRSKNGEVDSPPDTLNNGNAAPPSTGMATHLWKTQQQQQQQQQQHSSSGKRTKSYSTTTPPMSTLEWLNGSDGRSMAQKQNLSVREEKKKEGSHAANGQASRKMAEEHEQLAHKHRHHFQSSSYMYQDFQPRVDMGPVQPKTTTSPHGLDFVPESHKNPNPANPIVLSMEQVSNGSNSNLHVAQQYEALPSLQGSSPSSVPLNRNEHPCHDGSLFLPTTPTPPTNASLGPDRVPEFQSERVQQFFQSFKETSQGSRNAPHRGVSSSGVSQNNSNNNPILDTSNGGISAWDLLSRKLVSEAQASALSRTAGSKTNSQRTTSSLRSGPKSMDAPDAPPSEVEKTDAAHHDFLAEYEADSKFFPSHAPGGEELFSPLKYDDDSLHNNNNHDDHHHHHHDTLDLRLVNDDNVVMISSPFDSPCIPNNEDNGNNNIHKCNHKDKDSTVLSICKDSTDNLLRATMPHYWSHDSISCVGDQKQQQHDQHNINNNNDKNDTTAVGTMLNTISSHLQHGSLKEPQAGDQLEQERAFSEFVRGILKKHNRNSHPPSLPCAHKEDENAGPPAPSFPHAFDLDLDLDPDPCPASRTRHQLGSSINKNLQLLEDDNAPHAERDCIYVETKTARNERGAARAGSPRGIIGDQNSTNPPGCGAVFSSTHWRENGPLLEGEQDAVYTKSNKNGGLQGSIPREPGQDSHLHGVKDTTRSVMQLPALSPLWWSRPGCSDFPSPYGIGTENDSNSTYSNSTPPPGIFSYLPSASTCDTSALLSRVKGDKSDGDHLSSTSNGPSSSNTDDHPSSTDDSTHEDRSACRDGSRGDPLPPLGAYHQQQQQQQQQQHHQVNAGTSLSINQMSRLMSSGVTALKKTRKEDRSASKACGNEQTDQGEAMGFVGESRLHDNGLWWNNGNVHGSPPELNLQVRNEKQRQVFRSEEPWADAPPYGQLRKNSNIEGFPEYDLRNGKRYANGRKSVSCTMYKKRYLCTFFVGIEDGTEFAVAKRIIGPGGINMKQIAEEAAGSKIRLRGKGSLYKERDCGVESEEPLQINVSVISHRAYMRAKERVSELLQDIYGEYKRKFGMTVELNISEDPKNPKDHSMGQPPHHFTHEQRYNSAGKGRLTAGCVVGPNGFA